MLGIKERNTMTRSSTTRRPAAARTPATRTRSRRGSATEVVRWVNGLKAARIAQGKSQTDVANHIGRKQNTISAIERGARSGREYMDQIAEYLRVDPSAVFPYYDFYSYEEAAELMGVSSTLISRRVDENALASETISGMRLIPKSALDGAELRKRSSKSIRSRMRDQLRANPTGLTSRQLLMEFAPFEDEDAEKRAFQTVQQLLARWDEFEKVGHDADSGLLLWTVSDN